MSNLYRNRRKTLLASVAFAGALCLAQSRTAAAADYPSRPIKIVVAFAPGGLSDLTMREIARLMSIKLGQTVLVENKPSAGQVVGMQTVYNSAPDGYTLLMGSTTGFSIAPQMFRNLNLDPARFVPSTGKNFLRYVDGGFFTNGSFYRVVRADNQPNDSIRITVIQAGASREKRGQGRATGS